MLYKTIIVLLIAILCYVIYEYNIKNKQIRILESDLTNLTNQSQQTIAQHIEKIKYKNESIDHLKESKEQLFILNTKLRKKNTTLESTMESSVKEAVTSARKDSVKRQRSILKGQATEQLAPYINPNYNPKDYKFMGDPIDYIIFDGMSNDPESDSINKIVFMDIKTGKSQLNKTQKRIRKTILDGNIEFKIYRPEKDIKTKGNNSE